MSDFFSFVISLYLAIGVLSITVSDYETAVSANQLEGWKILHWLLALCCVAWYSMRLRHYFYRKTFWFELKEILRTLVIFAVIEIAVLAFANWSFSRFLWGLTWVFVLLLVPLARMVTKRVLDVFGLWHRDTWIIGSGANAQEAYKAINSERNLGLVIVGFIETTEELLETNILMVSLYWRMILPGYHQWIKRLSLLWPLNHTRATSETHGCVIL